MCVAHIILISISLNVDPSILDVRITSRAALQQKQRGQIRTQALSAVAFASKTQQKGSRLASRIFGSFPLNNN